LAGVSTTNPNVAEKAAAFCLFVDGVGRDCMSADRRFGSSPDGIEQQCFTKAKSRIGLITSKTDQYAGTVG